MNKIFKATLITAMLIFPMSAYAGTKDKTESNMKGMPIRCAQGKECSMSDRMGNMKNGMGKMMSDMQSMMGKMKDPAVKAKMQRMHKNMGDMMQHMRKMHDQMGKMSESAGEDDNDHTKHHGKQ